ncbi:MAG: hypothetical protein SCH71_12725 [Desulfobulbaceae bacterium]|nr:hypothetical protein [Desulfobulbaceae bacterium]
MNKFSRFIRSIKKKLFGEEQPPETIKPSKVEKSQEIPSPGTVKQQTIPSLSKQENKEAVRVTVDEPSTKTLRQPHFIQIGFDFGTSFSKCICRDVMTNKAWVYIPEEYAGHELPFLIPSAFLFSNGYLRQVPEQDIHYPEEGLYHLKQALVLVALEKLEDTLLEPYRVACGHCDKVQLGHFIKLCAVYFLANALGKVRTQIKKRMSDFGEHPQDYMAVNLAIPVADAEKPAVNRLYVDILIKAWSIADVINRHQSISLQELESLLQKNESVFSEPELREACLIYPEVSANVQGFVRSRVSSEGIYLFSDTGAWTVDQSTFIFIRKQDNTDLLTFLYGNILPCGSSYIELKAAQHCGELDSQSLEKWRKRKERGGTEIELLRAKDNLAKELTKGTRTTLAWTKKKLYVPEQLEDMRVIFGGGGDCKHPYRDSIIRQFSGDLFRGRRQPDVLGMPVPSDLDFGSMNRRWMSRLTVAYGVAFEKSELAQFIYPKDVSTPEPDQIWRKIRQFEMVSQDQC